MRNLLIVTALLTCAASGAFAQTTADPVVSMRVLTFDDPLELLFETPLATSIVSAAVEFDVGPIGNLDLDVVPVRLDVDERQIDVSYPSLEGIYDFATASFNGYELTFEPCVEFRNLTLLSTADIDMDQSRLWSDENRLYINVAGLVADSKSQFSIGFTTVTCGIS